MTTPIFNRDEFQHPDDRLYQIEKAGDHPNVAANVIQIVDSDPADCEVLNSETPQRIRPLKLDGLTLTNMNNNRGQKAITNRAKAAAFNADGSQPHQSEIEPGYPAPALEAWFMAVKSMMDAARAKGAVALNYWQAWNLTKRQHSDMYRAAFGDLDADPYGNTSEDAEPDEEDIKSAAATAANITNRIKSDSGMSFQASWNFARSLAPRLFNRAARTPARLTNGRAVGSQAAAQKLANEDRQRANIYFQKLVAAERKQCAGHDEAYRRVCNREPSLHSLVCGRLTGAQVFAAQPEMFKKLYVD